MLKNKLKMMSKGLQIDFLKHECNQFLLSLYFVYLYILLIKTLTIINLICCLKKQVIKL